MHYGNIKYHAIEDGVGIRTVLFVSGCRNHCKGCFQPQTWDFDYGEEFTPETENLILNSLRDKHTTGLTLLGGEPFEPENQKVLLPFVQKVKSLYPEKDVWAYSGYTFEQLTNKTYPCHTTDTVPLLELIDVLVDGKFVEEQANKMLSYRGSENQRVLDVKASLLQNKPVLSEYNERTAI